MKVKPDYISEEHWAYLERIHAEMERFRAKLPELLLTLRDKWVVFRDGEVHSVHDDDEAAFQAGVARFGMYGGQVIMPVQEERPVFVPW